MTKANELDNSPFTINHVAATHRLPRRILVATFWVSNNPTKEETMKLAILTSVA